MRAVIYARYSSAAQKEESIERQIFDCKKYAADNDIDIVGEYIDRAYSARTSDRPDFQKMVRDSKNGLFDVVLVWKIDRFARNRADSIQYKTLLKKNKVKVISVTENISDGPEGALLEAVLEGLAEYYSLELSQKVSASMYLNATKAKSNGGQIPFGFCTDKDGEFYVDESKRHIVVDIFERYANGETMADICRSLNEKGIKTSSGSVFVKNSLQTMLRNKKYIGTYVYMDIEIPDRIPAIVSKELFDAVQMKINAVAKPRKTKKMDKRSEEYLLTGKLFCGHCNEMMTGVSGTARDKSLRRYYKCNGRTAKICNKKNIRKEVIEDFVAVKAKEQLTKENMLLIAKAVVELCNRERENETYKGIIKEIRKLQKKQENLLDKLSEDDVDSTVSKLIIKRISENDAEIKNLELQKAVEESKIIDITVPEILFFLDKMRTGDINDPFYKRTIINIFVNTVILYDDGTGLLVFNTQDTPLNVDMSEMKEAEKALKSGSFSGLHGAPEERLSP